MNISPSKKASKVTYAIRNIVAEAKKLEASGKKILYCNIGDPCKYDFKTPEHIIEATVNALRTKENGYAPSCGILPAREAVSRHLESYNRFKVSPDDIFITTGGSEGIELALTALLDAGEDILTPAPGYPLYQAVMTKIGANQNLYYLDDEWNPNPEEIESKITEKTKGIILINPNNPTGAVYGKDILEKIIDLARRHNLVIFSDEIYDKLIFEKKHTSPASLCTDVPIITINGMSKAYLVPGWRVGWLALSNFGDSKYPATLKKLFDARLCSPAATQHAIAAALDGSQEHLKEVCSKLKSRCELVYSKLMSTGCVTCVKPQAAFYMMPKVKTSAFKTDEEFILTLLKETGVLFVHGSGFQTKPEDMYFRIVYLPQEDVLSEAMDKFADFVKKNG